MSIDPKYVFGQNTVSDLDARSKSLQSDVFLYINAKGTFLGNGLYTNL